MGNEIMQEGKVCIADGPVQTRDNLHGFKTEYNKAHPDNRIKTLADAIEMLIQIATLIEVVEEENKKLREEIRELKGE